MRGGDGRVRAQSGRKGARPAVPAVLRDRVVIRAEITELGRCADDGFRDGAVHALRWLLEGGAGPLTGRIEGLPVSGRSIVEELAAAEDILYGTPSACRDFAAGVEHALLWAESATAAPPRPGPLHHHTAEHLEPGPT